MYASVKPHQPKMTKQPVVQNCYVYLACCSNGECVLEEPGELLLKELKGAYFKV